jgi:hypothetical protein
MMKLNIKILTLTIFRNSSVMSLPGKAMSYVLMMKIPHRTSLYTTFGVFPVATSLWELSAKATFQPAIYFKYPCEKHSFLKLVTISFKDWP